MGRLGQRTSAALGLLTALAMGAVVATAPNDFPTPSDGIWDRAVPQPQDEISLALLALAALLFGTTAALAARKRRSLVGAATWLGSGLILLLLNIVIWRLHAPVSAGNGG
jgi:hypothetical protein